MKWKIKFMFETTSDFVFAGERHQTVSDIPQPNEFGDLHHIV
jgi:hypothetical protein